MTMTANKTAAIPHTAGGCRTPLDTLERSQSVSPPPILSPVRTSSYPLSDSEEFCRTNRFANISNNNKLVIKDWTLRASNVRDCRLRSPGPDTSNHLSKSASVACLDKRLSVFKGPNHKENVLETTDGDVIGNCQINRSTLSLGSAANQRNRPHNRTAVRSQVLDIRRKISEWECRGEPSPRLSLFVDKGDQGDRSTSEGCPSMLASPCSEKTFDFKGYRRMSRTFSECSYPETEEEETTASERDSLHRFERRSSRTEPANAFVRGPRKEASAVLNRIQKIEQALKENPGMGLPQLPSSCFSVDLGRKRSITSGTLESPSDKFGNVNTINEQEHFNEKNAKAKQGTTASSSSPIVAPESPAAEVNPVPKPKRTFEYEADKSHRNNPNNLPPPSSPVSPPPLPLTPAPPVTRRPKKDHRKSQSRKSLELEDASSVQSLGSPSPVENGTEKKHRSGSKSTLEENAYEDIVGKNPSGKGPRLPEVYCVISRLGCFDLFSKILDEVERRRGISAALVYPFMRSLMESPFPAPGKTIRVKTFLPGAGNEVIELRRPMDSRLEHVDFDCLFRCLSVRQIIRIFASLLLERRVIFVAEKLSTLSSCSHAVVALLYPFSWQHTFIPVLPSSMIDIVCCPTPFLVGLLSNSLPKLKELPVEEALMVDLGSDRFIRQMDDEDALLPRKLQAALEQALERKGELISQDSDSDTDEEYNTLNGLVSEVFIRFFVETIGHYSLFLAQNERGGRVFQREAFRKSVASKSIRRFLEVFMESQMFAGFIQDRELRKCRAKGLFEQRVEQYLEELPDHEQSGVNKFWRGLGNKMKFLHKKN
ncbi:DENN domain-containing protein 2B [Rhinoderma darwinii]|uniref:DENN domain-containing protein 2B n=1 Tax=Rhinoderma darwinii TaxID=43563 RepID=UPI003F680AAD